MSKPVFAQARIQFLKDGISSIYKNENTPEHPVLDELKRGIEIHKYPKAWIMRLINERLKDEIISKKSFSTIDQIEKYSELTNGTIMLLSLNTLGVKNADADMAAKNAARCIGLTNSLRAQHAISSRHVLLPLDLAAKHKVDLRNLVEKKNNENIEEMIFDMATIANANLTKVYPFLLFN